MAALAEFAAMAAALVGHFSITVWLFNRLHAVGWPRPLVKALEKLLVLVAAGVLVWLAARGAGWLTYAPVCWLSALAVIPYWLIPKFLERMPAALIANDTCVVDVAERLGFRPVHGARPRWLAGFPGNELLMIAMQRKRLRIANLPAELAGLKIAHLSDLHMTGQLGREFYDCVVDLTNAWEPDLIAITGDILEKESCFPWIAPTLGRLQARFGKFFVLGNHETRLGDVGSLRAALIEAGLTDLGGSAQHVSILRMSCLLAGIELPWFGRQPDIDSAVPADFRILLSHTPDNIAWARSRRFDLMLAGHTHGGQIRLPYLGALISPSWHGFRYAGGTYDVQPTLLHVSRGLAGIHPIRLNCPPELALLTLLPAATG